MKLSFLALAASGVLAAASPALADSSAPSGLRTEAFFGWDRISLDGTSLGAGIYRKSGVTYGGGIGYDLPVSSTFSLGADAEVSGSSAGYTANTDYLHSGREIYVGARGTMAVGPKTNVYVKVGYANSRLMGGIPGVVRISANNGNAQVGFGVQQSFTKNLYGLVEYRQLSNAIGLGGGGYSRSQVVTGFGYRF